jgi:CBS domain-containing protein
MTRLADIMTRDVVTVEPQATLRDVLDLLVSRGISGVPVVHDGRVLGVVSATDVLDFAAATPGPPMERDDQAEWGELEIAAEEAEDEDDVASAAYFADFWIDAGADVVERFIEVRAPEWDILGEHTVDEVMTRRIVGLPAETEVGDAARRMLQEHIHRLLVLDGEHLIGLVSATDFVRLLAAPIAEPEAGTAAG